MVPVDTLRVLKYFKMIARSLNPIVLVLLILLSSAISIAVQINYRKAFAYPHNFDSYHSENQFNVYEPKNEFVPQPKQDVALWSVDENSTFFFSYQRQRTTK